MDLVALRLKMKDISLLCVKCHLLWVTPSFYASSFLSSHLNRNVWASFECSRRVSHDWGSIEDIE